MLNFEIKTLDDSKKYVLIEGYKRMQYVFKDFEGAEYFYIPNYYNKDGNEKYYSFNRRVYDAIKVIMDGNGDVISFTGHGIHVQYYLDRSVGDEYRKRTIKGFKNCTRLNMKLYMKIMIFIFILTKIIHLEHLYAMMINISKF